MFVDDNLNLSAKFTAKTGSISPSPYADEIVSEVIVPEHGRTAESR